MWAASVLATPVFSIACAQGQGDVEGDEIGQVPRDQGLAAVANLQGARATNDAVLLHVIDVRSHLLRFDHGNRGRVAESRAGTMSDWDRVAFCRELAYEASTPNCCTHFSMLFAETLESDLARCGSAVIALRFSSLRAAGMSGRRTSGDKARCTRSHSEILSHGESVSVSIHVWVTKLHAGETMQA